MERNYMRISKAYILQYPEESRVCVDVNYNNHMSIYWYAVDKEYERYLCHERNDAFVVAFLFYCMVKDMDIISEGDVSAKLLYQLNEIFIPTLNSEIEEFHAISIIANSNDRILESADNVGTSYSGGIDSFYTILKNQETINENMKISCLTFFDSGFAGMTSFAELLHKRRSEKFSKTASKMGYPFLEVKTNIRYYTPFDPVVSFVALATALSIQKFMNYYMFSSTYRFSELKFDFNNCSSYDLLTTQCFSTENITFYSTGADVSRLNKLEYIASYPVAQKNLDVCWCDFGNCLKDYCGKCQRTLIELFILGKQEQFAEVFDSVFFMRNIDKELGVLLYQKKTKKLRQAMYERLIEKGYKFTQTSIDYSKHLEEVLGGLLYPEVKGFGSRFLIKLREELFESDDKEKVRKIKNGLKEYYSFSEKEVEIEPKMYVFNWLKIAIADINPAQIVIDRNWKKIAIFGGGKQARNLVKSLGLVGVDPSYIVDDNPATVKLLGNDSIKIIGVKDKWDDADLMVVTDSESWEVVESGKFPPEKVMHVRNLVRII